MHTEAFNHHPGQLMMNTGVPTFGRPSMGSWLNYGLGSESKNLPGYVVLTAGRGTSGGASNWSSGFLPTTYQGVLFRNQGEPVLNLNNPPGLTDDMQRTDDRGPARPEPAAPRGHRRPGDQQPHRRLRAGLPHAVGRAGADRPVAARRRQTLDVYGVDRQDAGDQGGRGGGKGQFHAVRRQLPAGPAAGRARRALRQPLPRLVGPPQQPRRGAGVQLPAWPTSRSRPCSRT